MAKSYRTIDYRIRPSKHVERKMLVELIGRVNRAFPIEEYTYVGLGSLHFVDFILLHRAFGITSMVSIERESSDSVRFKRNRPYSFIDVMFEETSTALQKLDWSDPVVAWLDYDDGVSDGILSDLSQFATYAASRSLLIVTVNAELDRGTPREKWDQFVQAVGEDASGPFETIDVSTKRFPHTCIKAMFNRLGTTLSTRNRATEMAEHLSFRPLASFEYQDGAKMATLAGCLLNKNDARLFDDVHLADLVYLQEAIVSEPYKIDTPKLTQREKRDLDQILPDVPQADLRRMNIPLRDAELYKQLYRYLPNYADVDL